MRLLLVFVSMLLLVSLAFGEENLPVDVLDNWTPLSRTVLNFGNMKINKDIIAWESGQKSTYKVIERGANKFKIELTSESLPRLHDRVYRYIKCYVSTDANTFHKKALNIFFYENYEDFREEYYNYMSATYIIPTHD